MPGQEPAPATATPSSSGAHDPNSRADVVQAVLKSKGINTVNDLDSDSSTPEHKLLQHHELIFIVELCEAQRPSKLGSLKGSHEKYEEEFARLQEGFTELRGDGSCTFHRWQPGIGGSVETGAVQRSTAARPVMRPQSAASACTSRPQSAASMTSRLRANATPKQEQLAPRIGAFEVSFKLVNTLSHKVYGPDLLFSKIDSGHWPGAVSQLVKRAQKSLQVWLIQDMGACAMFVHAKAQIEGEPAATTAARSGGREPG